MNKIKAAIIEDEIPAARLLRDTLLSLRPDWEVQLLPGNIEEAVEWFGQHLHPDILFLDIQLTDGNSFLFIEQIEIGLTHHLFSLIADFHFQTFSIVHRTKYRRINHHFLQYIIAVIRFHQSQAFIIRYRLSANLPDK